MLETISPPRSDGRRSSCSATRTAEYAASSTLCRHRGAQICQDGTGCAAKLVCPYHQWTYDLDGTLLYAGQMPDSFDAGQHSLRPIHVEVVAGVVYVCLADTPPDFAAFRRALKPMLARMRLEDTRLAHQYVLVENANPGSW